MEKLAIRNWKLGIICFLFSVSSLLAQTYDPSSATFSFGSYSNVKLSPDLPYFQQRNFMLGWQWGAGKRISQALDIREKHASRNISASDIVDSCDLIVLNSGYTHAVGPEILNGRGLQYEPTLAIDPNYPEKLIVRQGDTTRPVFGFKHRHGLILTDSTDVNFNRIIIEGDSLKDSVILSDPWPDNELYTHGKGDTTIWLNDNYLCTTMLFSINLRRNDNLLGSDPVIKIELQYKLGNGSGGNIQFAKIPDSNPSGTYSLPQNRGIARNMIATGPGHTDIIITRDMIPVNNVDITVSASFSMYGQPFPAIDNPQLKSTVNAETTKINTIGIKITYLDPQYKQLLIDWVRIETPHTKELLSGNYDQSLISNVQTDLNKFTWPDFVSKGARLFRYNTTVEGSLFNWISEKYFNKLIGNIGTGEVDTKYPKLYEYYVNSPDRWLMDHRTNANTSAPYLRKCYAPPSNSQLALTFGVFNGYMGVYGNGTNEIDPGKSHYETFMLYNQNNEVPNRYFLDNPEDLEKYEEVINYGVHPKHSYLANFERYVYSYFKPETEGAIYSDKFWWEQNQIHLNLSLINFSPAIESKTSATISGSFRPLTGEEFRLSTYLPVILGAKGLLYDGAESYENILNKPGIYDFNCMAAADSIIIEGYDDYNFLNSDTAGTDFFRTSNEILGLNDGMLSLDTIGKTMNRPYDKIYFGRKSLRLEMKKLHDWIREVEDTLMNLRLQSYYAKGFRIWYSQHPSYNQNDTILYNYVLPDSGNIFVGNYNNMFVHTEPWDSNFFDISLLKNVNKSLDEEFYIGVVNRRTSPLVLINDTLNFYSTAEFDHNVQYGGNDLNGTFRNAEYWQDLWWKRQGVRSFWLPFNYRYESDTSEYCLLRITELGGDLYSKDPTKWFWRKDKYYNYIDTTIGQDKYLSLNLLPGEGKILKIEVLHPANNIEGFLDYSNQCKIVTTPVIRPDGTESDSVRFHAVYYKRIRSNCDTMGVFYSRSKIMKRNSSNENIIWELPEKYLSYDIKTDCIETPPQVLDTLSCDYPSIVVRKINGLLKAFVVYQCFNSNKQTHPFDFIVESKFNVNGAIIGEPESYIIGEFRAGDANSPYYKDFGNPVINASTLGNYYAWSTNKEELFDKLRGIVVGYRGLNASDFCLEAKDTLAWDLSFQSKAMHPSVNSFSLIDSNESNCSLVWQEQPDFGTNQIYYTRLKFDTSSSELKHYIAPTFITSRSPKIITNGDSIIYLSSGFTSVNQNFPVIYRNLMTYNYFNPPKYIPNRYESDYNWARNRAETVYWSSYRNDVNDTNEINSPGNFVIEGRTISFRDSSEIPKEIRLDYGKYIGSTSTNYVQPNLAQLSNDWALFDVFYNINLSFKDINSNKVYNFVDQQTLFGSNASFNNPLLTVKYHYGNQEHLSQYSKPLRLSFFGFLGNYDIWKSRRIYEAIDEEPPNIITNAQGFYKTSDYNSENIDYFTGFNSSTFSYYVGNAFLNNQAIPWILPYDTYEDTVYNHTIYRPNYRDSIYTTMFNVAPMTTADLDFVVYGNNATSATIGLEGHPSNTFSVLPIPTTTPSNKGILIQYTFINMADLDYRVIFINNDSTAKFSERLFVGGLPTSDTIYARRGAEYGGRVIIDLNTGKSVKLKEAGNMELKAYPNPAQDAVFITVNYPVSYILEKSDRLNKVKIRIFSINGDVVWEGLSNQGETIKVLTDKYSQGMYFIQAEENITNWQLDYLKPLVERLIIER